MKSALLAILLANVPPGQTYYSVEPSSCGEECGATWSSHYESWVVQESAETGAARYEMIVDALVDEARTLLCTDEEPECVAYRGEASWKYPQPWELDELVAPEAVVERALQVARDWLVLPPRAMAKTRALARRDLAETFAREERSTRESFVADWFSRETQGTLRALVEKLQARGREGRMGAKS